MQPLNNLTHVEKAKLLFQFFPSEIPAFIVFEKWLAEKLILDKKTIEMEWGRENSPFTFPFWLSLAEDTVKRIEKNDTTLAQSSNRFADQLFDGYNAFFSIHCLNVFAKSQKCESKQFALAVELFFT